MFSNTIPPVMVSTDDSVSATSWTRSDGMISAVMTPSIPRSNVRNSSTSIPRPITGTVITASQIGFTMDRSARETVRQIMLEISSNKIPRMYPDSRHEP